MKEWQANLLIFTASVGLCAMVIWSICIGLDKEAEIAQRNIIGVATVPPLTKEELKIARKLEKAGSPVAVTLAKEIAQRKRPRLLTAVAVVESGGKPSAVGKIGERGVYQVRPELHGAVPDDVKGQVDQAEAILESLITEEHGRLRPALSRWNGDKSNRYADKVMREVASL